MVSTKYISAVVRDSLGDVNYMNLIVIILTALDMGINYISTLEIMVGLKILQ